MKHNTKYFKHILLSILLIAGSLTPLRGQFSQPLNWQFGSERTGDGIYEITASGKFKSPGWHIYDLEGSGQSGINSTVFSVNGLGVEALDSARIVSEVKKIFDPVLKSETGICEGTVVIKQTIKLVDPAYPQVEVSVEWQCCNDTSCLTPDEVSRTIILQAAEEKKSPKQGGSGLLALILEAILWGLAMLLTPCVFPMVPMTVSFFIKGSENKTNGKLRALMYGVFIILLYTVPICLIIGLTRILGGDTVTADIFNWLATHWLPNILFFVIFMIFAASFFGAFELSLPSKWVNKSDGRSDGKGLGGVFFLALTLVLVSFSCTGPIVGTVLIKSTQGQFWTPMLTMLAFSSAFAMPFAILAFFPSLLKKLPKSGGWLNSVKVVLGFIEIALGLKFLSTADQTYHWHLLDREVYLAIWIVTFALLGFYLLGKLRFRGEDELKHVTVLRLALSIASFSFVVYMLPGMWGAPLKALSGYLPPITTQDFVLDREQQSQNLPRTATPIGGHKYADFLDMPYGIDAFYDYEEARRYAAASGKPLFVDFTGHGCVNCREMETRVWSDPEVLRLLKEEYVVCALFADDKKVLDQADWVTTEDGKVLKSLGKINSHFALTRFGVNAQPYYVILDPVTENEKQPSRGYDLDVDAFAAFLKGGLQ